MPKRATVSGRADDVFFGLSEKTEAPTVESEAQEPAPPAKPARRATPPRSRPAAMQTNRPQLRSAAQILGIDAKINAAFRFSEEELDELDDFVRDAKRLHGLRVTKQDVVRLALALLMNDYHEKGEVSQLIEGLQARRLAS